MHFIRIRRFSEDRKGIQRARNRISGTTATVESSEHLSNQQNPSHFSLTLPLCSWLMRVHRDFLHNATYLKLETLEMSLMSWIIFFSLLVLLVHFSIDFSCSIIPVDSFLFTCACLCTLYLCINRVCKYFEVLSDLSRSFFAPQPHVHGISFNFAVFRSISPLNWVQIKDNKGR